MSNAVNSIKGLANNVLGNNMITRIGDKINQVTWNPFELGLNDKITSSLTHGQYGGGKGIGSLIGNKAAPPVAPPVVMPLPNDQAVEAAKKKQMAMMLAAGGGRASTILSQPSDRLGG